MERRQVQVVFGAVFFAGIVVMGAAPAEAQTFQSYRCADGTRFIVGILPV